MKILVDPIVTLDQFMKWTTLFDDGEYVFRGVPNEAYGIQASAYRRAEKDDRSFEKFLHINKDLITEARLRGYHQKDGRELKALEILADLQHFGAATCLIDFTYSAQIALFFACQQASKLNGKVFAVRKQTPTRLKEIRLKDLKEEDIDSFLKDDEGSQLYHWQPRQQNRRILTQRSIFLFGKYEFAADEECIIAGEGKDNILKELQRVAGITEDWLFPDFEGFAQARGPDALYTALTPSEYKNRGFLAYERGDYKDAIIDYDIAIDKDSNYAEAYYLRGLARKSLKQREESILDFNEAIRLDPARSDFYVERATARFSSGRYEETIIDTDDVIRLNSDDTRAYFLRGLAKYRLKRYEEAISDLSDTIHRQKKFADPYYWSGLAKYRLKRYEEAIGDFDDAIHLSIKNQPVYYYRGLSKKRLGQIAASIVDFDRAIRQEPDYAYSHYHRGDAKFKLERYTEAKVDLEKALTLAKHEEDDDLMRWVLNLLKEIDEKNSQ